jgi:membrane protease YdiL (CAAX protease family)
VHALWIRLPVLVQAVITGLVVAAAGTLPWAALVAANLKLQPNLPWSVPIMAVYLWLFWRYVRGGGWPRSTSATRRAHSRANALPADLWGPALLAGMLGLASVLLLQGVLGRLATLPQQRHLDASHYPVLTVLTWVLMGAVVAAVVEETAFRGYLQAPIERRHGPVLAILAAGSLFGLLHFTHAEVTLALLPYYLTVAAVYGALAHLTDSTLPSMALHGAGNAFSAFDLFARGRSEWQLSEAPQPLVWETGPDAAFFANAAALLVVGSAAVWAFAELSRAAERWRTRR